MKMHLLWLSVLLWLACSIRWARMEYYQKIADDLREELHQAEALRDIYKGELASPLEFDGTTEILRGAQFATGRVRVRPHNCAEARAVIEEISLERCGVDRCELRTTNPRP